MRLIVVFVILAKLLGRQQQQPGGSLSVLLGHASQGQSAGILAKLLGSLS